MLVSQLVPRNESPRDAPSGYSDGMRHDWIIRCVVAAGFDDVQCECAYEWFERNVPFERLEEITRDVEIMAVEVERAVDACLPR